MTDDRDKPVHAPSAVAARYRARAAARRRHARWSVEEVSRTTLLSIAETYEHIAESVERDAGKLRLDDGSETRNP
jgi:hypothetical protein